MVYSRAGRVELMWPLGGYGERYGIARGAGRGSYGRAVDLVVSVSIHWGLWLLLSPDTVVWRNSGLSHPLRILIRQTAGVVSETGPQGRHHRRLL